MSNHGGNDHNRGLSLDTFQVTRTDGACGLDGRHHGCRYFVLDLDHDPNAMAALTAYANSCRGSNPALAADLRRIVDAADPAGVQQL